jgi:outer membrane protein TolC
MSHLPPRIVATAAVLAVGLHFGGCASGDRASALDAAPRLAASSGQDDIRQLQQHRLDVLRQIHAIAQDRLASGMATPAEVGAARRRVLEAELEMADAREQRIAIHEQIVQIARENEETVVRLHELGRAANVDFLNASVARLEAEINLARARAE